MRLVRNTFESTLCRDVVRKYCCVGDMCSRKGVKRVDALWDLVWMGWRKGERERETRDAGEESGGAGGKFVIGDTRQ